MMIVVAILARVLTAVRAQGSTSADAVDFVISHLVSPGTRDQFSGADKSASGATG